MADRQIIGFKKSSLSDQDEKALRTWLSGNPRETLRRVVGSLSKEHLVEATNIAVKIGPNNGYSDNADAELKKGLRYLTFLDVLTEIIEQKERFSVITLQ